MLPIIMDNEQRIVTPTSQSNASNAPRIVVPDVPRSAPTPVIAPSPSVNNTPAMAPPMPHTAFVPQSSNTISSASPQPSPTPSRHSLQMPSNKVRFAIVAVIIAAGVFFAGYTFGRDATSPKTTMSTTAQALQVPSAATVISQCTQGLGTQYVLPKNIPQGPIYNVYQGKVIGLEYMVPVNSSSSSATSMSTDMNMAGTDTTTLNLYGMKYDHINVSLMPQGHAGLAVPHYMADVMTVPSSATSKITCSSSSTSSSTTSVMPSSSSMH